MIVYAVIIVLWILTLFLFGIISVVRTAFITIFFAVNIFRDIVKIRKCNYNNSIFEAILKSILKPLAAGLILIFTFYPMPSVSGNHPFQYRFSKLYTAQFCDASKQLLPENLPYHVSEYHFEYFPGFLQADSFVNVGFKTDVAGISEIEKFAEEHAVGVLDLEMYRQYNTDAPHSDPEVTEFKKSYFKPNEKGYTADYFNPRTGSAGENEGAGKMYIISSNGNWNHPHTICIIVNYDTCMVSFTY